MPVLLEYYPHAETLDLKTIATQRVGRSKDLLLEELSQALAWIWILHFSPCVSCGSGAHCLRLIYNLLLGVSESVSLRLPDVCLVNLPNRGLCSLFY